ncbi:MAG TPA: hypothetical protein ENK31_09260 [Nannocystis exedens]|nr:hypothetical protein [Nannocystis exedens]
MYTLAHLKVTALTGTLALGFACGFACGGSEPAPTSNDDNAITAKKSAAIPAETPKAVDLLANVPAIGDTAPPLALKGTGETSFDLANARVNGPVLAVFYRGHW